jgi:ABC-2 type transport system permease protein
MNKLYTIAKNTFIETIRQPVYAVIIAAAVIMYLISPALTLYSLDDDNKLLREIGLSTLFLAGLFIAIFSAAGALSEELENKTVTTVLSKPVQRPVFIIAKFLGVSSAVTMAHYICTIALLMTIRHGVAENADDTHDMTVLCSAGITIIVALLLGAFFNYYYDWKFTSTALSITAVFATFSIIFLAFIDRDWKFNPAKNGMHIVDIYGSILLLLAILIIVALAVALSTRFNIVITLSACIGIFLLGLINDYAFGRFAQTHLWAKLGRYIIPNLQIFWISDAIYEGSTVPVGYILLCVFYAASYIAAILALAVALFQRRQVG